MNGSRARSEFPNFIRALEVGHRGLGIYLDYLIIHFGRYLPRDLQRLIRYCGLRLRIFNMYDSLPGYRLKLYAVRLLCSDGETFEPSPPAVLRHILHYIGSDDVFVDLGCGKGDVLRFVATRRKLKKVIGVEIVPYLAQLARRTLAASGTITPTEVIEASCTDADISKGTVYYLFNSFGKDTLLSVLRGIASSLSSNPRKISILCFNPKCVDIFDETSWLRPETESRSFVGSANRLVEYRVWHNKDRTHVTS